MAFITLTSDYGISTPYAAALKGAIYSAFADAKIVDISHSVKPHDILQAAYILKNAVPHFPQNTIHFIAIETSIALHKQVLVVENKGQFFIGVDNGIFSLLFESAPEKIFSVKPEFISEEDLFPEKNLFPVIALKILKEEPIFSFADIAEIKNIKQNIAPVEEGNILRGNVIFVDGYGNSVTNISRNLFEKTNSGKARFSIFYRRNDQIKYISRNYHDVKNGSELALFNETGLLEIAMNTGKAGQLLGLKEGSPIFIEFYD
ncbi:MAG: S-adenosyl-l-methionine hydroxide adenosyltransferase family protein [Bacteroidia bacterium]